MLLLVAAGVQPMVEMMAVNFHLNLLLGQLDLVVMDELLVLMMMTMINNHLLMLLMMELGGIVWKRFVVVVVSVLVKHLNQLVKFLMKTLNFY